MRAKIVCLFTWNEGREIDYSHGHSDYSHGYHRAEIMKDSLDCYGRTNGK